MVNPGPAPDDVPGVGAIAGWQRPGVWGLLAALLLGHAVAPGPVPRYACYTAVALAAAALMRRGIRLHRPAARGWRRLELGLWLHAGYGTTLLASALLPGARWLSTAEAAVDGAAHLAMVAAAVDFLAVRRPGQRWAGLVDAGGGLLAAGLLGWQWHEHHGNPARLLDLGHAGAWVVALLMAAVLIIAGRLYAGEQRPPSFLILILATVLALTGNLAVLVRPPGLGTPRWVETLWLTGVLLGALAAQLPGMRLLGEPEAARAPAVSPARVLALGAVLLANPALIALVGERGTRHAALLSAGVTVLTVLVLWRIGRLLAERAALHQQLLRQATHDGLTGLPNRAALLDRLARPAPSGRALLFVDLDGFKPVNDRLGHVVGDQLLHAVAARLAGCLRDGDLAARLGGDEFAVLLHGEDAEAIAEAAARRVLAALTLPFALSAGQVTVGASIGIATSAPAASLTGDDLLRRADAAMYAAKRAGKNRYRLAEPPAVRVGPAQRVPQHR